MAVARRRSSALTTFGVVARPGGDPQREVALAGAVNFVFLSCDPQVLPVHDRAAVLIAVDTRSGQIQHAAPIVIPFGALTPICYQAHFSSYQDCVTTIEADTQLHKQFEGALRIAVKGHSTAPCLRHWRDVATPILSVATQHQGAYITKYVTKRLACSHCSA